MGLEKEKENLLKKTCVVDLWFNMSIFQKVQAFFLPPTEEPSASFGLYDQVSIQSISASNPQGNSSAIGSLLHLLQCPGDFRPFQVHLPGGSSFHTRPGVASTFFQFQLRTREYVNDRSSTQAQGCPCSIEQQLQGFQG